MSCNEIRAALSGFGVCDETPDGSRIATHCLYPSFEAVRVFVVRVGDGYKVHDGSGAFLSAWLHGRDEGLITKILKVECSKFHLGLIGRSIVADVHSNEWLTSAILGVANASAAAAHAAVSRFVTAAEEALVDRINQSLSEAFGPNGFSKGVDIVGKSGGRRHFDFSIHGASLGDILINGVSPHHGSVSAKYVSFADAEGDQDRKFAVFDKTLGTDDVALLQQVASIMPISSLSQGAKRAIANIL